MAVFPRRRHIFVTDAFDGIRHPMPLVTDTGSGFYCRSEQGAVLMSPGDIGESTSSTRKWTGACSRPRSRRARSSRT